MERETSVIACDLSRLNGDQRKREQELLGKFRKEWTREAETEDGVWFTGAADPEELAVAHLSFVTIQASPTRRGWGRGFPASNDRLLVATRRDSLSAFAVSNTSRRSSRCEGPSHIALI
jgi:hypothetical protein